jgi:DNA-binding protein HU-beta
MAKSVSLNEVGTELSRDDLIALVATKLNVAKTEAKKFVVATFDLLTESMVKGKKVNIRGFGIFSVKGRAARTFRNPHDGSTVDSPACSVPAFKPSTALKDSVMSAPVPTKASAKKPAAAPAAASKTTTNAKPAAKK